MPAAKKAISNAAKDNTTKMKKSASSDRKAASSTSSEAKGVPDPAGSHHIIVSTESERKTLLKIATATDNHIDTIHTMEIHLNASRYDEFTDDHLAIALNAFHPRPDGTNPHRLSCIKLVMHGTVLFTRYNYVLVSPAISYEVTSKLHMLVTGGLTLEEKANLAYKANSTEKSIAKALLGIRGVNNVIIEGRGKMEAAFADSIKRTLPLPPGTDPILSQVPSATLGLDREGELASQKYQERVARGKNPYSLRKYIVKSDSICGKTRALADEKALLLGHFPDQSEEDAKIEAINVANEEKKTNNNKKKRKISQEESNVIDESKTTSGAGYGLRSSKKLKVESEAKGTKHSAKLPSQKSCPFPHGKGMHNMIRIIKNRQDGEDLGKLKSHGAGFYINQRPRTEKTKDGEWLVLTGKGGMIQLGWKTT